MFISSSDVFLVGNTYIHLNWEEKKRNMNEPQNFFHFCVTFHSLPCNTKSNNFHHKIIILKPVLLYTKKKLFLVCSINFCRVNEGHSFEAEIFNFILCFSLWYNILSHISHSEFNSVPSPDTIFWRWSTIELSVRYTNVLGDHFCVVYSIRRSKRQACTGLLVCKNFIAISTDIVFFFCLCYSPLSLWYSLDGWIKGRRDVGFFFS